MDMITLTLAVKRALQELGVSVESVPQMLGEAQQMYLFKGLTTVAKMEGEGWLFECGRTYIVNWNGVDYTCKAESHTDNGTLFIAVGDMSVYETGEMGKTPFLFIENESEAVIMDIAAALAEESVNPTYSISILTETIHPIDRKYLPGACLPVVELSEETVAAASASPDTFVNVTEDEATAFLAAKNDLVPCVCRASMSGTNLVGVSGLQYTTNGLCYVFDLCAAKITVSFGDAVQIMYSLVGV